MTIKRSGYSTLEENSIPPLMTKEEIQANIKFQIGQQGMNIIPVPNLDTKMLLKMALE